MHTYRIWILACLFVAACGHPSERGYRDWDDDKSASRARHQVYATVQHTAFEEKDGGSKREQDGVLYGVGYELELERFRLRTELLLGDLSTSELENAADPGDSEYVMFDTRAEWLILPQPEEAETPRPFQVFLGGGIKFWSREAAGTTQDWISLSAHAGAEYSHWFKPRHRLFVRGLGGANLYARADATALGGLIDGPTVDMAPGPLARLELGWEHDKLAITGFVDWSMWGESDTDQGVSQPDSTMTRFGLGVGFTW